MDIKTPPNTPITALLAGEVSDISAPLWGKQLGIELYNLYNGIPYMAYLHLSAIEPSLQLGSSIEVGQLIGWSGGATTPEQYVGTSNPTGANFLDAPDMSSQPQTGIAFMRGPVYGSGKGWTPAPDPTLDPTSLIWRALAASNTWHSIVTAPFNSGIAKSWRERYHNGILMPPPTTQESPSFNWSGQPVIVQEFGPYRCEWDGSVHWYRY